MIAMLHFITVADSLQGTTDFVRPRRSCNWMGCVQHVSSSASYGFHVHVHWVRRGACMHQTCLRAGAGWCGVFRLYYMLVPFFCDRLCETRL
jgi:hypothetical protein